MTSSPDTAPQSSSLRSLSRQIVRASMLVALAHVLFKFAGLLQVMVMGHYIESSVYDVVYVFAFEGVIFSLFLIGEEVIGPTFLPLFMGEKDTRSEDAAWRFANTVVTLQFILLVGVVFMLLRFPSAIVRFVTLKAWTGPEHATTFSLARESLTGLAPALICLSIGSTTYMLLNAYKRFFLAAFGDAAWKFCVLLFVLVGVGWLNVGYRAVILGLLVGSVAKLGCHLVGLRRERRRFRLTVNLRNPAVRSMFILMLPLIFGIVFAKIRDLFNNVTVLSQLDTAGLMQANSFGRKLYLAIGWFVPYAISIAMFPFLCELVDTNQRERFAEILTKSGRMLLAVFIPFALVCSVLAYPMSFVLFHGGKFTMEAVLRTSVSTACYTLVLPAAAIEYLLMQAFFANRRMIAVTIVGIAFSVLSMGISYVGVVVLGATGIAALAVVALGFTVSRTLKAAALVVLLRKNAPIFPARDTLSFLLKVLTVGCISAGAAALCLKGMQQWAPSSEARMVFLLRLAGSGMAAGVGYVLAVYLLRIEEPVLMLKWSWSRVRERIT